MLVNFSYSRGNNFPPFPSWAVNICILPCIPVPVLSSACEQVCSNIPVGTDQLLNFESTLIICNQTKIQPDFNHFSTIRKLRLILKVHLMLNQCRGSTYTFKENNHDWSSILIQWALGNSIWIPHTPCRRFKKPLLQKECEFQVNKLIWHFWRQYLLPLWWII